MLGKSGEIKTIDILTKNKLDAWLKSNDVLILDIKPYLNTHYSTNNDHYFVVYKNS